MTKAQNIRIILIDDHRRVHQAISEMLSFFDDIELLAQGSNGLEAISLCRQHQPDIVLMDVVMPVMDGVEATRRIIKAQPQIKVLALSSFKDQDTARAMLEAGAVGYVLKDSSVDDLENTIRTTFEGQGVLSPEIMQTLLDYPQANPEIHLSPREEDVLKLLSSGMTHSEIASRLVISVSTVKYHVTNILDKLGVETKAEALVFAAKNNLI